MTRYQHIIPVAIMQQLLKESAAAEEKGSLTSKQLEIIYQEKWFKLFVPVTLHGLELSLVTGIELEEALAYLDGSLGWTVTLCAGASFFAGYLHPAIAAEIFQGENVCFAGSGQPGGTAVLTNFGYSITGHWQYASGAAHATIFTANCYIERDGELLKNAEGLPIIQAFYFTREEVTIVASWETTGLIATSGYSFEVHNLFVPKTRTFLINSEAATISHPIYRFPFLQFAEVTIAANTLGMAFRFVDLCRQIFQDRDSASIEKTNMLKSHPNGKFNRVQRPDSNKHQEDTDFTDTDDAEIFDPVRSASTKRWRLLVVASETLRMHREQFYNAIQKGWEELLIENAVSAATLLHISATATTLVWEARTQVGLLYPHCGLLAADPRTEINRVWRDIHTASQHSLLK